MYKIGLLVDYSLKIGVYIINYESGTAKAEKGDTIKDVPKVCELSNDIDENAKAGSGKIGSILYDENSVKIYLDEYKNKLEILGLKLGAENIRLIETDELFALGMKSGTNTISDKEWIYTVSYWVVPTDKSSDTWHVQSGGRFLNFYYQYAGDVNYFGVRPVIIIPSTEI